MNIREREQLEYIHTVLQECMSITTNGVGCNRDLSKGQSKGNIDNAMISQALEYVEIIREQHFKKDESYSEVCDKLDSGEYYSYDK